MPELAFGYLIGLVVAITVVTATYFWNHRRLHSKALVTLNSNLQKIGKYWSNTQGQILSGSSAEIEKDRRESGRSFLILGALLCIGSWLGLFVFLLTIFSIRKITITPIETKVFASPLAQKTSMTTSEVENVVSLILEGSA